MRRDKLANAESLLKQYEEICGTDPSCENKENLEIAKNEYNLLYEHLSMVRLFAQKLGGMNLVKKVINIS